MEQQLTKAQIHDLKVLVDFVRVYCHARHSAVVRHEAELSPPLSRRFRNPVHLCQECAGLVAHAIQKRQKCPLEPKPSCKKCPIHCYSRDYRAKIREIMAFSGRRMIMRGRLDYLWHYLF